MFSWDFVYSALEDLSLIVARSVVLRTLLFAFAIYIIFFAVEFEMEGYQNM